MFDSLQHLLNAAGREPLLTADEEILLGRRVQAMLALKAERPDGPYSPEERRVLRRGMQARDRMVTANLRLVANVCRKFLRTMPALGVSPDDMMQDGIMGLVRGVEGFDPERGYKLSTYIYWWIRQGINRGLHSTARTIRLPTHVAEKIFKINMIKNQLRLTLGREAKAAEVAEALGVSMDDYRRMLQLSVKLASLDATAGEDGSPIIELLSDGGSVDEQLEELSEQLDQERLERLIREHLNPKQQMVVRMHFGIGMSQKTWREIGKAMGMHHEGARDHLRRALLVLKREMLLSSQVEEPLTIDWELAA